MGSIYRPKYIDRHGRERSSSIWWMKYYSRGRAYRESTETADYAEAKEKLKSKEGDAAKGRVPAGTVRRVLFSELAELVKTDYELNRYRSLVDIELRFRLHILPVFGKTKAMRIGEADVDRYILRRREAGAANGTINRELATIKRAFILGIRKKLISDRPHISMLEEDNVRQGFFEPEQFRAVLAHLPERLKPVARFAYVTGWRRGEIIALQWWQVDFLAGIVRLEPGTTKNREARQFPFTDELLALLAEQRAKADQLKRKGVITPYVFFYEKGVRAGRPVGEFKHSWETACKEAGVPGKLMHDFRRTAVRNLVRAGVPERVAMKLTGHRTRSVFERYNIVSEGDLRDAAQRLNRFVHEDGLDGRAYDRGL